jgi:ATP synthase F0 subunit b
MLDINITVLYQIFGYFALLVILNQLLYKPILRILKERADKTTGELSTAAGLEKEADEGMVAYDKKIKDATIKGLEEKNRLMQEALKAQKGMIEHANGEIAIELGATKKRVARERDGALVAVKGETQTISKTIAEKLLDRKFAAFFFFFISVHVLPALAFAEEHGGGHAEEGPGEFWRIVTFVVLVVGFLILWKKLISVQLNKRADGIKKDIEDANSARTAAEQKANAYRQKLSLLEQKIAEITGQLRKEGEAEKDRILRETEDAVRKFKEQAKMTVEQEIKKARIEIQSEVAALAVKMAEEILKKEIQPEDQERLIKNSVERLRLN